MKAKIEVEVQIRPCLLPKLLVGEGRDHVPKDFPMDRLFPKVVFSFLGAFSTLGPSDFRPPWPPKLQYRWPISNL
jgi:hypothetical protein